MDQSELGARLRQYRLRRHLTQQQVAGALHCRRQTYSNYERGTRSPDFKTFLALADLYGVSADDLLGHTSSIR